MPIQQTIDFDNSYACELEGFYVAWNGDKSPDPKIIQLNRPLAIELGLDPDDLDSDAGAAFLAGSEMPDGAVPLAQVYAGHQFGGFSQQLGDGRALLVGEVLDRNGNRRDIHLKGSGKTPFSRGGDGKAVLGPVLREYLMGEAMHRLGIPTTRALAAVTTGEQIRRDGMQPGAVLARVASSHLRVGTFQFFAARGEVDRVRKLADYAIKRHYPDIANDKNCHLSLLRRVIDRQAALVAKWVAVGFVHGVMNTDNMTISGETIDYGPCAFIDYYDPNAVFSSIDEQGRYSYGNQPVIAQWNLARFAETLLPLIDPDDSENATRLATREINAIPSIYKDYRLDEFRLKLGMIGKEDADQEIVDGLHSLMEGQNIDYTNLFRRLADVVRGNNKRLISLFKDGSGIEAWLDKWMARVKHEPRKLAQCAEAMDKINPIYIPRNHKVEEALLAAANNSDFSLFYKLLDVLSNPFEQRQGLQDFEVPAPADFGRHITYCGT